MGLFLASNDDITCFCTWELISLTMECVLVIVWSALVNGDLDDLLLLAHLLSIASLAFVGFINHFTLSTAIIAGSL
jgi:hypothetical protein